MNSLVSALWDAPPRKSSWISDPLMGKSVLNEVYNTLCMISWFILPCVFSFNNHVSKKNMRHYNMCFLFYSVVCMCVLCVIFYFKLPVFVYLQPFFLFSCVSFGNQSLWIYCVLSPVIFMFISMWPLCICVLLLKNITNLFNDNNITLILCTHIANHWQDNFLIFPSHCVNLWICVNVSICCLRSVLNFPRCYSFIGRLGYGQDLSLSRSGCVYHHLVQHEVLHALGFHHEQKRSDRDQYIRVQLENVTPGVWLN